jgi:hypothetical protein
MPIVLAENEESESGIQYADHTGVSYQFPKIYRGLIKQGERFVYYRGRKKKGGGRQGQVYFGTGVIGEVRPDGNDVERLTCDIHDYRAFDPLVPFKQGKSAYLEAGGSRRGYFQRGVRAISDKEFAEILKAAGLQYESAASAQSGDPAPVSVDIGAIATLLNARANAHAIGQLQNIRTKLKGFSRPPGSVIFSRQTVHSHWAFHHGGHSELQFNIGLESMLQHQELRHGVAFSFELSQALPEIDVLIAKVRLFNDYLLLYPELYADMRMWHYREHLRSTDYSPGPILPELVTPGSFVFLGRRQPIREINYEAILNDFDRLLPLYEYVESGGKEEPARPVANKTFQFRAGCMIDKARARRRLSKGNLIST